MSGDNPHAPMEWHPEGDCGHLGLIASGEARGLCPLCQRAEIEQLTAFLHRIRGANDNPSCYNANVEAVLNEWRAVKGMK